MGEIVATKGDRYVTLTIDRAHRRNSLSLEVVSQLTSEVQAAGRDEGVHAVVITGAGPAFCSGADFEMLGELVEQPAETIAQRVYSVFQGLVRTIIELDVPVIAAVNGPALGAGCDLALACDCRVVTPEARFEETWIKLGLLPGMGGLALLPPLVGLGRSRSMLYRAEPVDGRRAVEIGLADVVVEHGTLSDLIDEWLEPIKRADRTALTWAKRGTRRAVLRFLEDDLDFVSSRQGMRIASAEVANRLKTLTQK